MRSRSREIEGDGARSQAQVYGSDFAPSEELKCMLSQLDGTPPRGANAGHILGYI